jgi:type VI secretion system protein ImpC
MSTTPTPQNPETPHFAAAAAAGGEVTLDSIIADGKMIRNDEQKPYARDLVGEFVNQVLSQSLTVDGDTIRGIQARIAEIDETLSRQLDAVMHDAAFQKLEASWRGLKHLVFNSETGQELKIRVLNVTRDELFADLDKAVEFDQSVLFKRVYEDEYGTFGGNPFSLLVGDFEFGRGSRDIALLENISHVAAAAHAPFIAAASPALFDWQTFGEMSAPRDLAKGFSTAELTKWRSFRESEDSRYVALTLPHILLRLPYGPDTTPVEGFKYEEHVAGPIYKTNGSAIHEGGNYLWGNSAYALAQRISNAFSLYHWCAAIRGVEGGGKVEGLPAFVFKTEKGDSVLKCPTEIAITDRREKELSDLGFISLCHCKGADFAAFFGGQTTNKPKLYNTNEANANSRISAMLPYILATSRFAHYLKSIMRDKIGSFMTRENVQAYLNTWISDYVLLNDDAPRDIKARFPLRDARVDVAEVPGKPGVYKAIAYLKPHFQLEELTISLRLVAELPPPAA